MILLLININTAYAKEINKNAAQYITDLYNNAAKTVVSHNTMCLQGQGDIPEPTTPSGPVGPTSNKENESKAKTKLLAQTRLLNGSYGSTSCTINYNYATGVNLMNDRFGGTTASLDGGNIRYYGKDIYYYDSPDGVDGIDGTEEIGIWKTLPLVGDIYNFKSSKECKDYIQFSVEHGAITEDEFNEQLQQQFGITAEDFCSTTTKYYKKLKNYIDIGDRTTEEITKNNWENLFGNDAPFNTSEECNNYFNCSTNYSAFDFSSEEECNR